MFIGSCRNIFFVTRADAVTESVKYYRLYNSTGVRFTIFPSGGFTIAHRVKIQQSSIKYTGSME